MATSDDSSGANDSSRSDKQTIETAVSKGTSKLTGGIFLAAVAGLSVLGGFGMTVAMAKKKDPNMFSKGLIASRELPESGGALATRALAWGTLYSITGVSFLCFTVWKLMGVHNMKEFTAKMQSVMPSVPKRENQGRSEFKSIRELFEYLIDEDRKSNGKKKS